MAAVMNKVTRRDAIENLCAALHEPQHQPLSVEPVKPMCALDWYLNPGLWLNARARGGLDLRRRCRRQRRDIRPQAGVAHHFARGNRRDPECIVLRSRSACVTKTRDQQHPGCKTIS